MESNQSRALAARSAGAQALATAEGPITQTAPASAKPAPAALSVRLLCERLDISESTLHRIRDEDWFPRPIMLSPKCCRWIWAEVEEALRQRAPRLAVGANAEPEDLAAGRAGRKFRSGAPA